MSSEFTTVTRIGTDIQFPQPQSTAVKVAFWMAALLTVGGCAMYFVLTENKTWKWVIFASLILAFLSSLALAVMYKLHKMIHVNIILAIFVVTVAIFTISDQTDVFASSEHNKEYGRASSVIVLTVLAMCCLLVVGYKVVLQY